MESLINITIYYLILSLKEILAFFLDISPYLLFGFLVAGILHVFFPDSLVRKHLGKNNLSSVLKSTFFGIPLPLCSCGVVPAAAALRKSGASKGATVSFLISTPQIGADSFLVTSSLIGWVFGVFRITASFITAFIAGIIVNITSKKENVVEKKNFVIKKNEGIKKRFKNIFTYIQFELLGSIANSLILGIIIAGIISALVPEDFLKKYLGNNFLAMIMAMIVGIPMYICATSSTPIAASLIIKGLSPGAALVYLLTGPATNAITISTVVKTLGKKAAIVYLTSIALVSLGLGALLDYLIKIFGFSTVTEKASQMLPNWLKVISGIILFSMIVVFYIKLKIIDKIKEKRIMADKSKTCISVNGMTCPHCSNTVKKAVESIEGTSHVFVDLEGKKVEFDKEENVDLNKIKEAIENEGYSV